MAPAAMPRPGRTVRQGIAVCHRAGLTTDQACQVIMAAADAAIRQAAAIGGHDLTWLTQVRGQAAAYRHTVTQQAGQLDQGQATIRKQAP